MAAKATSRPGAIPRKLIDFILLGPPEDQRQLQDSPLQGDVWLKYAEDPTGTHDLLITPNWDSTASRVRNALAEGLRRMESSASRESARIAFLQGLVAAQLSFPDALRIVIPMTMWWRRAIASTDKSPLDDDEKSIKSTIDDVLESYLVKVDKKKVKKDDRDKEWNYSAWDRFVTLAALILWARQGGAEPGNSKLLNAVDVVKAALRDKGQIADDFLAHRKEIIKDWTSGGWGDNFFRTEPAPGPKPRLRGRVSQPPASSGGNPTSRDVIFQVSLNRRATPALFRSVPAVKGDAARMLFKIECADIVWAVLDAGIDRAHTALEDAAGNPRVLKTFDFTCVRDIVSLPDSKETDAQRAKRLCKGTNLDQQTAKDYLEILKKEAEQELPFNWGIIEHFVTRSNPDAPGSTHGTHVAGIVGAREIPGKEQYGGGMCPDIGLYDFRVLGRSMDDTEFAVIAALQYIRYINARHSYITIHGANLSLSIPHSVRNFACGRTPVCEECERVVDSGVVVVAAAGNRGYQHFETSDGVFENYAALSITDPGNADGVITVGATHRNWAHTYGVSFFSSRGPTGDGRLKPDLVAPGERIQSTTSKGEWAAESGTSMAAPHVSGAAAMLLARYPELIGHPRRIKQILCSTATDLGRERSFQGHGMLDVLRALQSI